MISLNRRCNIIKTVTLRLSDEIHKSIKRLTVEDEITIQDYIAKLIESDLNRRKSEAKQK